MTKQTLTAFFDTRDHAESAALALRQSGVPASDITVSPENARDELTTGGGYAGSAEPKRTGFMATLEELFGGYEDRDTYAEGVRRGGTLLTTHLDEAHVDRAAALLEQYGAVDLNEREETWRGEGWNAGSTGVAMAGTGVAGVGATGLAMAGSTGPTTTVETTQTRTTGTVPSVAASVGTAVRAGQDDVLQVVEERLNVGKRAVNRGKVRLHTYAVEREVSENVTLRDETVSIERRPVDRPVAALGADAFQERTIEMEEIDEEAVVGKTARVVEEIGIRKDATERTETVSDTVRSTKVDIEDGRVVGTAQAGTMGDMRSRLTKDLEVVGSDGRHVGVIDHVEGGSMKLKRLDPASGGQHHLLPTSLVASVDRQAMLNITAAEAEQRWTAA